MSSLCTFELVHLDESTSPINNGKNVNFLSSAEDLFSKISADLVHGLKIQDR